MDFWPLFLNSGLVILGLMFILWLISLMLHNSSIVDIFWGTGFVVVSWIGFLLTPDGFEIRNWLMTLLVSIWGLRLSLFILKRSWGKPEDYRYRVWREAAGASWWWRSFFKVFLLQGFIMWIISTPLLAVQVDPQPERLTWLDILAIVVWISGFFFEAVGDWQLARFKADASNKGKVFTGGLWRYTRHPNYFGDATQWWAYYLLALAANAWWTFFSPIIMTYLLLRVSGVALLEKTMKIEKPGYDEYVNVTPAFFPWFPRQNSPAQGGSRSSRDA